MACMHALTTRINSGQSKQRESFSDMFPGCRYTFVVGSDSSIMTSDSEKGLQNLIKAAQLIEGSLGRFFLPSFSAGHGERCFYACV